MKRAQSILFSTFIFIGIYSIDAKSSDGGINGGGGNGVVCYGSSGEISSVELHDFYEGRILYGQNVIERESSWREQVKIIQGKYPELFSIMPHGINDNLQKVLKVMNILPEDTRLAPVQDRGDVILPRNCKIEQLAHWIHDNMILIDGFLWKHLSNTHKAGLIFHEAIYKYLRATGDKKSFRTRKFNVHLFSNFKFVAPESDLPNQYYSCSDRYEDPNIEFYFFPIHNMGPEKKYKVIFKVINRRPVLEQTSAFVRRLPIFIPGVLTSEEGSIDFPLESQFEPGTRVRVTGSMDSSFFGWTQTIEVSSGIDGSVIGERILFCGTESRGEWSAPDFLKEISKKEQVGFIIEDEDILPRRISVHNQSLSLKELLNRLAKNHQFSWSFTKGHFIKITQSQ